MKRGIRNRLLRSAFQLLYKEFAFAYDSVSRLVSLNQWRDWQRAVLPYLEKVGPGVILELAHGTGALQVDLLREDYATVALDLSPTMGSIAKKRLSRESLSTDFIRGDALSLPFANGSFAAIVATFPTSFILNEACLAEINRVLAQRGRAIIVMSALLEGRGLRRAFIRLLYRITGQSTGPAHSTVYKRAFAGHGLSVEQHEVACQSSVVHLVLLRKALTKVSDHE